MRKKVFFSALFFLLLVIAAPSFSYYKARARASEARIALQAIAGSERAYFSEYHRYSPSMDTIGYQPGGGRRFYQTFLMVCSHGVANVNPITQDALSHFKNEKCAPTGESFVAIEVGKGQSFRIDDTGEISELRQ